MIDFIFQSQKEYLFTLIQMSAVLLVFAILYCFRKHPFALKIVNIKISRYKLLYLLIVLAAVFTGLLFAIKMPILGDEAVYALSSYGAADGLIPYKDFAFHAPPLLLYVYGLFFKIIGTSILAARILSFLFFLSSLYLIYRIFAFYFKKAFIPLAVFLLLVLLHPADFSQFFYIGTKEVFAFFIILLSLFFLKNNMKKSLFLSGVFAGLAFMTKQTFFVLLPVAFLVILITNYKKEGLFKKEISFFLGVFGTIIPFVLFFLPYSRQILHNTLTGLWESAYFIEVTLFPIVSNLFELKLLTIAGWTLRHYVIFSTWIFLLIKFFLTFRKNKPAAMLPAARERWAIAPQLREKISNIPSVISFPILFIFIYGISSLLFVPTSLYRHLIIMNIFLYFSVASLAAYFLEKYQHNIKIKRIYLVAVFLALILIGTNPKQISYYSLLNNQVLNQYRDGAALASFIKLLPEYENRQVFFLGSSQHLLAQGGIPAKKIYPATYLAKQFGVAPFENLSLSEAQYYHYLTKKVFEDIIKRKKEFIVVLELFFEEESDFSVMSGQSFSNQKTMKLKSMSRKIYKIYY